METSLTYDNKDRSLGLAFKERLRESDNEVELKVSGLLNTKTGRLDGFGSLRKFIFLGGQLPDRNPYLRPAAEKRRTRFELGVSYNLKSEVSIARLGARKNFQLGDRKAPWLKLRADADFDIQRQKPCVRGRVEVTKDIFDFSSTQDLRLRVGCDATASQDGNETLVQVRPYGQIRENNWSLNTDFHGFYGVRYDL